MVAGRQCGGVCVRQSAKPLWDVVDAARLNTIYMPTKGCRVPIVVARTRRPSYHAACALPCLL
jgi:hypothetical protein